MAAAEAAAEVAAAVAAEVGPWVEMTEAVACHWLRSLHLCPLLHRRPQPCTLLRDYQLHLAPSARLRLSSLDLHQRPRPPLRHRQHSTLGILPPRL